MERRFVISTVGISTLLGMAKDSEQRSLLIQYSNEKTLSSSIQTLAQSMVQKVQEMFQQGDIDAIRRISAELNGLYGLYENNFSQKSPDMHWLIATDTALGRYTAEVVKTFLENKGFKVQVHQPQGLSTASSRQFSQGMQNLLKWCEDTIPGHKNSGYRIVFNLTGGFKSLQGYLNIIGMFYADEIIYIFEGSSDLLRIPRLPIQVDRNPFQNYAAQLAMMEVEHIFPSEELRGLPEGMLDIDDQGYATVSDWGLLIWYRLRRDIFQKILLDFPRLFYSSDFRRDFEKSDLQDRVRLQSSLAKVSHLLVESAGNPASLKQDGGLQYDNYVNKRDKEGYPIGHFRVSQGLRVSCIAKEGTLHLRRFGKEPEVNNNP